MPLPGPKAAWLWIVGVCGMRGWKRAWEGFEKFLEQAYYSVVFPHVWGSGESWQYTSGSWWNGPQAVVCLTDVSKQAPVAAAAMLFVCLHDITLIIYPTSMGLFYKMMSYLSLLWSPMFVRMEVYLQLSFKTSCISLRHISACCCSTDVLNLSAAVHPFLSPLPLTQFKLHETNLSSP